MDVLLAEIFNVTWKILLVIFLVFLNGFFVAAEFSMVKIRETRIKQLIEEGNVRARYAGTVVRHLNAYLSATQLGITLASLGLGWIGEPVVARLIEPLLAWVGLPHSLLHPVAFVISFSIITSLHIVLGEVAPKSLAIQRAQGTVLWTSPPMVAFYKLFLPVIWFLNKVSDSLLKLLGIEPTDELESAHTEEEIKLLMKQSHKQGYIDNTEKALIDKIFNYSERVAKEVMVPRIDLVSIDRNDSFEEILRIAEQHGHTRYPISDGDKDHIVGFIHIKDLYKTALHDGGNSIDRITRSIIRVSEQTEIDRVLKRMQKTKSHMALVVDEFGGTAGLITIEDILEELVGEIQDEFDDERPPIEKKADAYSIDGGLLIEEVNDHFKTDIEAEEDYIGGWMYAQLNKTPEIGDSLTFQDVTFAIEELEGIRITRILVKREDAEKRLKDSAEKPEKKERE